MNDLYMQFLIGRKNFSENILCIKYFDIFIHIYFNIKYAINILRKKILEILELF